MTYTAAVATSDGVHVDVHFGQAARFCVIEVDEEADLWRTLGWREVSESITSKPKIANAADASDRRSTTNPSPVAQPHSCHARFDATAAALHDVDYVWAEQIGPKAYRVLRAHGICPLEVPRELNEAVRGVNAYRARTKGRSSREA